MLQEPYGYELLKEIYDLGREDVRGLKKLMDWVVTRERTWGLWLSNEWCMLWDLRFFATCVSRLYVL